ncbi:MAG: ComF family protein [Verrucomicrobia bacterium]|nr:ComF family protein [Verrucomicrobiota bacterium]
MPSCAWMNRALALVYPDVCEICRRRPATAAEGYVCGDCWSGVRFIQSPFCERCGLPFEGEITSAFECTNCRELQFHFDSARSAVRAQGVVLEVIHRYKYHRALWFEPFLTDLLIRQARPALLGTGWDVIVPVPLHPVREREREFNQAARLAITLGHNLGLPVRSNWLRRIRHTRTQTLLTRKERAANLRRAFALRNHAEVQGLSCVLVDDVFTTGATTNACAGTLKAAGAHRVCVWTVARGV